MTGIIVVRIGVLVRIRHREDGVIEEIEGLKPELHLHPLRDGEYLLRGEIEAHKLWTAERSPAPVAKYLGIRGCSECGQIPIVQNLVRPIISVSNDVAVILLEVGVVYRRVGPVPTKNGQDRSEQ